MENLNQKPVNLLVADDHVVLREALCEMLESIGKYKVISQVGDGEEVLKAVDQARPDILILDVAMPKLDGISTIEKLKEKSNGALPPILILSADDGERNIRSALRAGARGFVPKNASLEELKFALDSILSGKTYLSPTITSVLMSSPAGVDNLENPLAVLSKRELEIFKLLAEGKANRIIAKTLFISPRTVDTHRSNILKKLNINSNAELVKLAIAHGIIEF
ncbi:MAG TPA: response regulator transcription factor [Oligoflexia bacterium]|nr:response regulator transcription factor [Oligoflexia bacterium]HMP27876.1 response regulator transcription factor [Oligoflexia bacterium]